MIARRWMLASLVAAGASASSAGAFTIASGFSDPCHEGITLTAYETVRASLPSEGLVVPPPGEWEGLADYLFEEIGVEEADRRTRYLVWSLLAGVRSPDTDGHSTSNIVALRNIHENAEGQYDHCLRGVDDDFEEGNAAAADSCVEVMLDEIREARDLGQRNPEGQNIRVSFTLDFYGRIEVSVWGPAYHLARALHAAQDSFAHTIRSADLRRIYHVMNYAEAVGGSLRKNRDGLAHSDFSDVCSDERNLEPAAAAVEASTDLLRAGAALATGVDGEAAVAAVMGKWFEFEPGCSIEQDFCGSPWVERARRNPSGPILGCTVGTLTGGAGGAAVVVAGLVALGRVRRRREARTAATRP